MRSHLVAVALAAVLVSSARAADMILFATEASENAVYGFCLQKDGSLEGSPSVRILTGGTLPRRLVVQPDPTGMDGTLYVVENDRVEAFKIGAHGGLTRVGGLDPDTGSNPLDVAVSEDGSKLYVPNNAAHRIAAFPIDVDGGPMKDFTSCINAPAGPAYQRLVVHNGLLYATADFLGGRIVVYPIAADGNLPVAPADCKGNRGVKEQTCPLSERRKLLTPGPFVITDANILYVESLAQRRILAFPLTNGLFAQPVKKKSGEAIDPCANDKSDKPFTGVIKYQKALNKTAVLQQYHDMTLYRAGNVIYGSQFTHGRVDAYRIKPDGKLPKTPSRRTKEDVRQSPVGLAVDPDGRTLYVATGEFDRVQAFRLNGTKALFADAATPFSETAERTGSFPNALATADLSKACGQ